MTKTRVCRSDNLLPTKKLLLVSPFLAVSNFEVKNYWPDFMISKRRIERCREKKSKQLYDDKIVISLCRFDIYTQPFITGIVKERFDMCQVGNICLKSLSMD